MTYLIFKQPELELNYSYCDFFLLPDSRWKEVRHSYILELKYIKTNATAVEVER